MAKDTSNTGQRSKRSNRASDCHAGIPAPTSSPPVASTAPTAVPFRNTFEAYATNHDNAGGFPGRGPSMTPPLFGTDNAVNVASVGSGRPHSSLPACNSGLRVSNAIITNDQLRTFFRLLRKPLMQEVVTLHDELFASQLLLGTAEANRSTILHALRLRFPTPPLQPLLTTLATAMHLARWDMTNLFLSVFRLERILGRTDETPLPFKDSIIPCEQLGITSASYLEMTASFEVMRVPVVVHGKQVSASSIGAPPQAQLTCTGTEIQAQFATSTSALQSDCLASGSPVQVSCHYKHQQLLEEAAPDPSIGVSDLGAAELRARSSLPDEDLAPPDGSFSEHSEEPKLSATVTTTASSSDDTETTITTEIDGFYLESLSQETQAGILEFYQDFAPRDADDNDVTSSTQLGDAHDLATPYRPRPEEPGQVEPCPDTNHASNEGQARGTKRIREDDDEQHKRLRVEEVKSRPSLDEKVSRRDEQVVANEKYDDEQLFDFRLYYSKA